MQCGSGHVLRLDSISVVFYRYKVNIVIWEMKRPDEVSVSSFLVVPRVLRTFGQIVEVLPF